METRRAYRSTGADGEQQRRVGVTELETHLCLNTGDSGAELSQKLLGQLAA